jgi:hypothetical protein
MPNHPPEIHPGFLSWNNRAARVLYGVRAYKKTCPREKFLIQDHGVLSLQRNQDQARTEDAISKKKSTTRMTKGKYLIPGPGTGGRVAIPCTTPIPGLITMIWDHI